MNNRLTVEEYIRRKQYTLAALALFLTLTFQLSSSTENIDSVFALISGLITQFMFISLNNRLNKDETITLGAFHGLIVMSSIIFPFWAMFRLPYFLSSFNYTIIFWMVLMIWALINTFRKREL